MRKILAIIVAVLLLSGGVSYGQKREHNNDDLQKLFDAYNDAYFNGVLPPTSVTWADLPKVDGDYLLGQTTEVTKGHIFAIEIDTKTNIAGVTTKLTLLHEMCHVATMDYAREHGEDMHGPRFQMCEMRLAENGAMRNLW